MILTQWMPQVGDKLLMFHHKAWYWCWNLKLRVDCYPSHPHELILSTQCFEDRITVTIVSVLPVSSSYLPTSSVGRQVLILPTMRRGTGSSGSYWAILGCGTMRSTCRTSLRLSSPQQSSLRTAVVPPLVTYFIKNINFYVLRYLSLHALTSIVQRESVRGHFHVVTGVSGV